MNKMKCVRWVVDIGSFEASWQQLMRAVSAIQSEERARLIRFHFYEDFLASLVGRLLMRRFVQNCGGVEQESVQLDRDERGKPFWRPPVGNNTKLSFNVSHQGNLVVFAGVVADNPNKNESEFGVGVDVMKIELSNSRPVKPFFNMMSKKFSPVEWEFITNDKFNEREQLKAFMRNWCLKEAYVKELGVGITIDLKSLSFHLERWTQLQMSNSPMTSVTLTVDGKSVDNYHFEEHLLAPEYCCAVAFKNCRPNPSAFETVSFNDLLSCFPTVAPNADESLYNYCKEVLAKQQRCRNM